MTDQNKAAPAPSSLAGGEVLGRITQALVEADEEFGGMSAYRRRVLSEAILAALSPEAPAREGRLREALIRMIEHFERVDAPEADKAVIEYASKAWAGVDSATGVTGASDETEALAVETPALTPRHEAPAREGVALDKRIADAAERDRRERDKAFRGESYEPLTPRHEAPSEDGPVFHMNLLSHEDNEAWLESARRVAAKHEAPAALCDHGHTDPMALCSDCEAASVEAPAEGAGEAGLANDIAAILDENADTDADGLHNASQLAEKIRQYLRARSSAPEAREGGIREILRKQAADPKRYLNPTHAASKFDAIVAALKAEGA